MCGSLFNTNVVPRLILPTLGLANIASKAWQDGDTIFIPGSVRIDDHQFEPSSSTEDTHLNVGKAYWG